jgi:alkylhydroperoxidase family enzyme
MTKLNEVIARVRSLSQEDQDDIAAVLAAILNNRDSVPPLTDEQVEAVRRSQEAVRRGETASDEEMNALWRRFGLEG